MLLFVNNLHEKCITESNVQKVCTLQKVQIFGSVHMLFVICTRCNFVCVLHEKCTIFQPIRRTWFLNVHHWGRLSLHLSHVTQPAGLPIPVSIAWSITTPPGWDDSLGHHKVTPSILSASLTIYQYPFKLLGGEGIVK